MEGEFMETQCRRNLETDLKNYEEILWKSTADTEACTRLGSIVGGGSKTEVKSLAEFGRRLGFIYRLIDDVKDSLNLEGNLSLRLENESVPLPVLYAAKYSIENYSQIRAFLDKPHISPAEIKDVLTLCFETEAFRYVLEMAKENSRQAKRKLGFLKKSGAQKSLALMLKLQILSLCL
jgi:geranylgeranyl pyrophosphate synthase